jgi:hypothetical protein
MGSAKHHQDRENRYNYLKFGKSKPKVFLKPRVKGRFVLANPSRAKIAFNNLLATCKHIMVGKHTGQAMGLPQGWLNTS